MQGEFRGVHDRLYSVDDWLNDAFIRFAEEAGVGDIDAYRACVRETAPMDRIEEDLRTAQALELGYTPSIIIDGVLYSQAPSGSQLEALVEKAIAANGG